MVKGLHTDISVNLKLDTGHVTLQSGGVNLYHSAWFSDTSVTPEHSFTSLYLCWGGIRSMECK
jgi:hypothetical protein